LFKSEKFLTSHIRTKEFARLLSSLMPKVKDDVLNLHAQLAITNYKTMHQLASNEAILEKAAQ
jgi:hypothetical protein